MSKNAYLGAFGVSLKFLDKVETIVKYIPSDSSTLPFKAAMGLRGDVPIRKGRRKAEVSPFSAITFFVKVNALIEHNQFAKKLIKTKSLDEIDEVFKSMGKMTELDHVRICEKIFASKKIIPDGP